jgi:hypothetical protein
MSQRSSRLQKAEARLKQVQPIKIMGREETFRMLRMCDLGKIYVPEQPRDSLLSRDHILAVLSPLLPDLPEDKLW